MDWLTTIDEWVKSHEVQASFWGSACTIATFVGGATVIAWRWYSLPFNAALAKRLGIRIAQATGIVAFGFLVGWRCGLGAPDRKAALYGVESSAVGPLAGVGNKGIREDGGDSAVDERPSNGLADGNPRIRISGKPIICGDHIGASQDQFELIGNETYRCKICGQTGMLGLSLVDGGLVFSPD